MAFNQLTVEQLTAWCFDAEEFATERKKAWAIYMNIWNNTPQPDRGGKSAHELSERRGGSARPRGNA